MLSMRVIIRFIFAWEAASCRGSGHRRTDGHGWDSLGGWGGHETQRGRDATPAAHTRRRGCGGFLSLTVHGGRAEQWRHLLRVGRRSIFFRVGADVGPARLPLGHHFRPKARNHREDLRHRPCGQTQKTLSRPPRNTHLALPAIAMTTNGGTTKPDPRLWDRSSPDYHFPTITFNLQNIIMNHQQIIECFRTHLLDVLELLVQDPQRELPLRELLEQLRLAVLRIGGYADTTDTEDWSVGGTMFGRGCE